MCGAEVRQGLTGAQLRTLETDQSLIGPLCELHAELFALQSFLGQSMSRVAPAMKSINKTTKWFLERGISVGSYKSFYNFLNSRTFEELKKAGLSSDDLIEYYTKAHESGKSFAEINKLISEYIRENSNGEVSTITAKGLADKLGVKVITEGGAWRGE